MSDPDPASFEVRVHRDDAEDLALLAELSLSAVSALSTHVLVAEGVRVGEVDLVFCGDDRIAELNLEWLEREGPTDCIAFDLREEKAPSLVEGEVYIDISQAERQAPEFEATIDEELRRLIIHGLLHLLGYTDTGTPAEAEQMRECQESLVSAWTEPILGGRE